MKNLIEHEYKYLLNQITYENIKEYATFNFKKSETKIQTNYYYDDDNFSLNRSNTTLRVRQINDKFFIQQKKHETTKENYVISEEICWECDSLPNIINDSYLLMGCLNTSRESFITNDNIRIDFDSNNYLGFCDYEVEIEFNKEQSNKVTMLLKELGLTDLTHPQGKSSRFFEKLTKLGIYNNKYYYKVGGYKMVE